MTNWSRWLGEGVQVHSLDWSGDKVHYVKVDLDQNKLATFPASDSFPIAIKEPIGNGLASIGAGFKCNKGQPCHLYVKDKEIWTTGVGRGGVSYIQAPNYAEIKRASWSVHLHGWGFDPIKIEAINSGTKDVCAFTKRGGSAEKPEEGRYYLVIEPTGDWVETSNGWVRDHEVVGKASGVPPWIKEGQVVIDSLHELAPYVTDRVKWVQTLGVPKATEVISGMTLLVSGGINVAPGTKVGGGGSMQHDGYYYEPCPRAALGVGDGGKTVYLLVVDGKPANEAGITLPKLARFFVQELGVDSAVNLDGGGAAILWTKEYGVVSNPSYGIIRPAIYSTVVLPS